jgi:RNA polymerase sigma factor (TIGR02999 family)
VSSNLEADAPFDLGTDELVTELYWELRKIAHREHYRAGMPATLQTTAIIGEAYVKLQRRRKWEGRGHFLACAATAMRHVLIDAARARIAERRRRPADIWDSDLLPAEDPDLVRLGSALIALSTIDAELARLVDCRFFAGYDEKETAEILGMSERTVRRRWVQARAWIHAEMENA